MNYPKCTKGTMNIEKLKFPIELYGRVHGGNEG